MMFGGGVDGFSFSEGERSLAVNAGVGAVRIDGPAVLLDGMTVTGGAIDVARVETFSGQTYTGATTLRGDLLSDGGVTFDGPVVLASDVSISTSSRGNSPVRRYSWIPSTRRRRVVRGWTST